MVDLTCFMFEFHISQNFAPCSVWVLVCVCVRIFPSGNRVECPRNMPYMSHTQRGLLPT